MSYSGRQSVNVTNYLRDLNTVPPPGDSIDSPTGLDDDLALFTSSEFMNWDGPAAFEQNPAFDVNFEQPAAVGAPSVNEPKMDFNLAGNFDFGDFSTFQNPLVDPSLPTLPQNTYPIAPAFASPNEPVASPITPAFDSSVAGQKRKLSSIDPLNEQFSDEAARQAAEEDKRRRNTAASARFRIKKKQREQALEKTAKDMSDRVALLETKLSQLERENTWLKGLITEKNGGKSSTDLGAMLKKHEELMSERIGGNRNDGVGTKKTKVDSESQ